MRKRILSLILVFALLCTLSISVSATTVSETGVTPYGKEGSWRTRATLGVYTDHAHATTWSGANDNSVLNTTLRYIYIATDNDEKTMTRTGTAEVTAYPTNMKDALSAISGNSQHSVTGGVTYGNWDCYLEADVW